LYPSIGNNILLESLIDFVENKNDHPEKSGIANSTLYKKPNGRKIDSLRNYKLVREADDLEIFNLYVEITKGQNRGKLILVHFSLHINNERLAFFHNIGHFKLLKNHVECDFLLTVALEKMSESGVNTVVKDLKDAADKENLFISRERCEFVNRCVLGNVAVTTRTTTTLSNVKTLGNDCKQQQTIVVPSKASMTRVQKPVVYTSKCSTKLLDEEQNEEEDKVPELIPKVKTKTTRSTPKLKRLRPKTVGIDVKELVSTSYESPTDNSTNKNKRKEDKKDDENAKQMIKKKKTRSTAKKH
jgi:hypothetical protein